MPFHLKDNKYNCKESNLCLPISKIGNDPLSDFSASSSPLMTKGVLTLSHPNTLCESKYRPTFEQQYLENGGSKHCLHK